MLRRLCLLLVAFALAAGPLSAATATAEKDLPTEIIPTGQQGDQFDADFADKFDDTSAGGCCVDEALIDDPLEGVNRGVFWFNDKLYFYLIKPVARGYRLMLPSRARVSVSNAFSNAAAPIRVANALLQLKFRMFGNELYRFIFNSTVGVAGMFDPAAAVAGIEKVEEDFGQTLGYYGAGHGFYLVLPVVGPSSLRDAVGSAVDTFVDPLRYTELTFLEYMGVGSFKVINSLSLDHDTYEGIVRDSLDPYLFVRAAYAQRRAAQVGKFRHDILSIEGTFLDDEALNPFKWLGL